MGRNAIPGSLAKASIHLTLQGFRFSHPPSKFRAFDAAPHSIFIRDGDEFHHTPRGLSDGLQIIYDEVRDLKDDQVQAGADVRRCRCAMIEM